MPTTVINQRDSLPGWRNDGQHVYVGRHAGLVTQTPGKVGYFGNPFPLKRGEPRGTTLARFREYAENRIATDPAYREAVKGLAGKTLVCWCAPEPCHGDVLAELAERLAGGSE